MSSVARTKSKPPPGIVEALKSKTAALENATLMLKAVQAVEREPVAPDVDLQAFSRAYARWLRARAAIKGDGFPEDEQAGQQVAAEERAALRQLFSLPALYSEDVFQKFEALEAEITDDSVIGKATDTVLPLALGSIKTDLINLGIGGGQ